MQSASAACDFSQKRRFYFSHLLHLSVRRMDDLLAATVSANLVSPGFETARRYLLIRDYSQW